MPFQCQQELVSHSSLASYSFRCLTNFRRILILDQCRQVLQSAPQAIKPDRSLQSSLSSHINQGTIISQCEVVRDLSAYSWRKPLFGPIADFQRRILTVLCQEWAVVSGLSVSEASHEINILLKAGRAVHEN